MRILADRPVDASFVETIRKALNDPDRARPPDRRRGPRAASGRREHQTPARAPGLDTRTTIPI